MLDPATVNSSFSQRTPFLQTALDSTSLSAFKRCPRYYQLTIMEGWRQREESPHLTFGILLHQAREIYEHAKAGGAEHEAALDEALQRTAEASWNRELGRPWISDHPLKNRRSLLKTVVWYLDAKAKDDPIETVILAGGKPAVELSFRFDSQLRSSAGEAILLCGHLDRIGRLNEEYYIPDIKTASSAVDARWARQFTPHNQFSLYTIAGRVAFGFPIKGVILDGIQVGADLARFQRFPIERTEAQLEEWLRDLAVLVRHMEECAVEQYWPMNDTACDMYGGCPLREVCSRSPVARERWLAASFHRKIWDPLQVRGEI